MKTMIRKFLTCLLLFTMLVLQAPEAKATYTVKLPESRGGTNLTALSQTTAVAGSVTLTADSPSYQYATHSSGVVTYTLPIASTCPGKILWISYSLFGGTAVINRQSTDTIITGTTMTLQNGEFIGLISSGAGRWSALSMALNSNNSQIGNTNSVGKWQVYSNNLITGTVVGASSTQPYFRLDASGGAVLYTLLSITASDQDLVNVFVRTDSSANTCTIQRGGDDTIGNGAATSITLPRQGSYVALMVRGGTGGDTGKWRVLSASPDVYGQLQGQIDIDHNIVVRGIGNGIKIPDLDNDNHVLIRTPNSESGNFNLNMPPMAGADKTIAAIDAVQTFTGAQTFTTPIAATSGGTAQSTYTTGDTIYASSANTLSKRPIGAETFVYTVTGGVPVWAAPTGGGGNTETFSTKTATYPVVVSDENILFNISSAANADLPTAASASGRRIGIKNQASSTANVTIDPNGAELIENASSFTLAPGDSAELLSDGTAWHIM